MSNHCRQIWPQVVYTSSKTADNTHSFSLPIPCRLCSSKEAQSDNKAHRKNARRLFFIVHTDQHCSTFKSISLFFSWITSFFGIKHNLHPFLCFISCHGTLSNIWMAASLSEKLLRILLHKCNLKAHHLFIKLLTSKPCPKRRHFNTIPLCRSRYACKEKEAHKGKRTWCSLNGAWVTTSTYKQAIVVASLKKLQSPREMRARWPIRPLRLMGNVSRRSRSSLQAKFGKRTCPFLATVGTR